MKNKKTNSVRLLVYLGIALIIIGGTSFAYLNFNFTGNKTNLVKAGCLKVSLSDTSALTLYNAIPISDSEGVTLTPYVYTIKNTCTVDAYYESTYNVLNNVSSDKDSKVKINLTGDGLVEPTILSDLSTVTLEDASDVRTSYLLNTGYLKAGEEKTFNLRTWINYDVTEFSGDFNFRVIVTSTASTAPSFAFNTSGYQVLSQNSVISTTAINPNFSLISPSTTDDQTTGLYQKKGLSSNLTYYFRGDVTNNYVKFGKYSIDTTVTYKNSNNEDVTVTHNANDDMIWRIVRINEDGTLRLVLDDFIGTSAYNTSKDNSIYTNYLYTLNDNDTSSTIKTVIDNWYTTHLETNYQEYLADSSFCNDSTLTNDSYFASYSRNVSARTPSFDCETKNLMYVSNGKLTNPIGLLSADELVFAGNSYNLSNTSNYLYKNVNGWYTLTPAKYEGNVAYNFVSSTKSLDFASVDTVYAIRPVINLKSNLVLTGNGSSTTPYEVTGFNKDSLILTINPNSGLYNNLSSSSTYELQEGDKLTLQTPVKSYYDFVSWEVTEGDATISSNVVTMGKESSTIKANYEKKSYVLTIDPNGGTYDNKTTNTKTNVIYGDKLTLSIPTKEGYVFTNWTISGKSSISSNVLTMNGSNTTITANYISAVTTYETPQKETYIAYPGTYKLEVWGAQGGSGYTYTTGGGLGGYATGTITLTKTTTLYAYVGGQGSASASGSTTKSGAGFNSNGIDESNPSGTTNAATAANSGGGGGGASDIRISTDSLYARVLVAGGGGGKCGQATQSYCAGGAGGGITGTAGTYQASSTSTVYCGQGGTATAGGATGTNSSYKGSAGGFGYGGYGGVRSSSTSYRAAGAGGGGWYGGGGGSYRYGGGGGGSSYYYTADTASQYPTGCLLNESYYLTDTSTTSGIKEGNGKIVITVISINY